MLDVLDFIIDKGGDPAKVKESQRRRRAPTEAVDEVIMLYEEVRKTKYGAAQAKQQINASQKETGRKKKAGENADDLLQEKKNMDQEQKEMETERDQKDEHLQKKLKTIENYVHDSLRVSNNEFGFLKLLERHARYDEGSD